MKKKTTTFGDKFLADHEQHTVRENWTKFQDHIEELTSNNLPWMISDIKIMCKIKPCRLYNAAKKRKKDKLWDAYRKLQNKTRNALRTAHWDYVNGIISDGLEKANHQPFWSYCCVAAGYTYKYNINTILSRAIQQRYSQFEGLGKKGRITWPHGGTHLQNEAGAFHAPSVQPDPDPLHSSPPYF